MPAKNFANAQDLVNIKEIRESTVILKDGSLRQVIMVGGVNFSLKSDMEQNIITQSYQNFLNGIDFPLQIVIHSRKINIEKYLEGLGAQEEKEISPLLKNQTEEYREFVRGFVAKNPIMEKTFLVVVPFFPLTFPTQQSVSTLGKYLPFLKKSGEAEEKAKVETEKHFNENLAQLKQRANQAVEGIFSMGLEAAILNNEQLVELFYNFYNPETIERENINLPKE
jgi:type IV secretory pathway VirB4 component